MKRNVLLAIAGIVILAGAVVAAWLIFDDDEDDERAAQVTSFEECVAAGYPVMESFPRQCKTPDGTTFTEVVEEQEQPTPPDQQDQQTGDETQEFTEYTSNDGVTIRLAEPLKDSTVSSPLTIEGEVPGSWSFEASFPVVVTDWDGRIIAQEPATLQGDWMTEDYVPFTVTLTFDTPEARNNGAIIFQKANPSDLPENDDALELPVLFE